MVCTAHYRIIFEFYFLIFIAHDLPGLPLDLLVDPDQLIGHNPKKESM